MHELMPSAPAMVVATAITTLRMMLQMFFLFAISVVCLWLVIDLKYIGSKVLEEVRQVKLNGFRMRSFGLYLLSRLAD